MLKDLNLSCMQKPLNVDMERRKNDLHLDGGLEFLISTRWPQF